jgi:hypothetical protein
MTMINRTVVENELLQRWESTNVVAASRTRGSGREDLAQRTERFQLSRDAA